MTTAELAALDRQHLWHPFTQQQGWQRRGPADHRARRGHHALRHRGQRLPRRRLVAVVQRPRPPPPGDRRRDPAPARPRRPHHACSASRTAPAIELAERLVDDRARRAQPRLLLRQRLDRRRDRAEDGLPVLAARAASGSAPGSSACATAYHGDTIGSVSVGGIELFHSLFRPLLFDAWQAAARATPTHMRGAAEPSTPRRVRGRHRRAARAGRRRACSCTPTATCARCASCATRHGAPPDLRRGGHRLRAHRHDVRRASRRASRRTSCAWPRGSPAATCRSPRR